MSFLRNIDEKINQRLDRIESAILRTGTYLIQNSKFAQVVVTRGFPMIEEYNSFNTIFQYFILIIFGTMVGLLLGYAMGWIV